MFWMIYLLIIYGILFYTVELIFYDKFLKNKNKEIADKEIEGILNSIETERIVLSYPYHNFNIFRLMLNTKHKAIYPIHMIDKIRKNFVLNFEKNYTYLNLDKFEEIVQITNCSVLILYEPDLINENFKRSILSSNWTEIKLNNVVYNLFIKN
jgi:hypothetical protein